MATINDAKALGLGDEVGSLERRSAPRKTYGGARPPEGKARSRSERGWI